MTAQFALHLAYCLALLGCLAFAVDIDESRVVRIILNKYTGKQTGERDQPLSIYYSQLSVGTPPKTYFVVFDLNAKESWLPAYSPLGEIIYYRLHYKKGYSKAASLSGVEENLAYTFEYQQCKLTGKVYKDVLEFENRVGGEFRMPFKHRFLAISSASNDKFSNLFSDGVIGLSPKDKDDNIFESILYNLRASNKIDELKFTLKLKEAKDHEIGGELALGGTMEMMPDHGIVHYHTLVDSQSKRWEIKLDNVMLGAEVVSCQQRENGCVTTLSTIHNDFYGPRKDVEKILELLSVSKGKANKLNEIECTKVEDAPTLTFNIDGTPYAIPPSSYIKKRTSGLIFKSTTCYISIFATQFDAQWILGTNFLSNYYSEFDLKARRVAFAKPN